MKKRINKFLLISLQVVAVPSLLVWFYSGYLENKYVTYPRQPSIEGGLTVPYSVKGITVYIAERDAKLVSYLRTYLLIIAGPILVLGIAGKLLKVSSETRSSKEDL